MIYLGVSFLLSFDSAGWVTGRASDL